jgi:tetraacyldisaccharide 4'-kinase
MPSLRAALEHGLRAAWNRRGVTARALWPLAQLNALAVAWRKAGYRSGRLAATRLPVPVIVVGNVVAGGAGKTPTTLAIATHLKSAGWRPGIVSRGYGRRSGVVLEVTRQSTPEDVGDEPLLLHRRAAVPVFVGRQRAQAGAALLATHPDVDVLLCDDGLQHLALARDIEIGVFDARGVGNGWLLPAGPLREPWPRPVDLVLTTEEPAPVLALPAGATLHHAKRALGQLATRADGQTVALADLKGTPLTAVAGIARPEAFFAMLRAQGLNLTQTLALPDHADFVAVSASLPVRTLPLCTEKDAPKLWRLRPDALAVTLELDVPATFFRILDALLARVAASPPEPAST